MRLKSDPFGLTNLDRAERYLRFDVGLMTQSASTAAGTARRSATAEMAGFQGVLGGVLIFRTSGTIASQTLRSAGVFGNVRALSARTRGRTEIP